MADSILFPYINLEDLCKAQPLLIFLKARAFNLPWTFVNTEHEFNPFARLPLCPDCNMQCAGFVFGFTKDPKPGEYGKAIIIQDGVHTNHHNGEETFYVCQRQGLQKLYVQERIYTFLLGCCKAILHDVSLKHLSDVPILNEQGPYVFSEDSSQATKPTTFLETILLAPYRARSVIDFHRLRAYCEGMLSASQDHAWASREDPGYFADRMKELENLQLGLIKDTHGRVGWRVGKPAFQARVTREFICDAYMELACWKSLYQKTETLCHTATDGLVRNFHEEWHQVQSFQMHAGYMLRRLTDHVICTARASPALRCYNIRHNFQGQTKIGRKTAGDFKVNDFMVLLEELDEVVSEDTNTSVLFYVLDRFDVIIKRKVEIQSIISPLVASDIAKLSIVAECLRQINMWLATPEIHIFQKQHVGSQAPLPDDTKNFFHWLESLETYEPPKSAADLSKDRLNYPILHYQNRQNLEQMRRAENNLDVFWDHVDSYFEEQSGKRVHEYIRPFFMGEMRRTPPETEKDSSNNPGLIDKPLSEQLHDTAKQITGVFDRSLKVTKNAKIKRHGLPRPMEVPDEEARNDPGPVDDPSESIIRVDKRTLSTIRTLFGGGGYSESEISRNIKWDDFVRAMVRVGFSAEKLQDSAWQFTPHGGIAVDRGIQFHEPHPERNIPYTMARRFGRRLERVYGWTRETFQLA